MQTAWLKYSRQGRLDKAVETYLDNIYTLKRLSPCGDYLTITKVLCCIADVYICHDQKEEALNIYCDVLKIRMDVLPKDHVDIANCARLLSTKILSTKSYKQQHTCPGIWAIWINHRLESDGSISSLIAKKKNNFSE